MSSHSDAVEARVADAPRAGEIVVVVADSGCPLPRFGSLLVSEIKGEGRFAFKLLVHLL